MHFVCYYILSGVKSSFPFFQPNFFPHMSEVVTFRICEHVNCSDIFRPVLIPIPANPLFHADFPSCCYKEKNKK